VKEVKLSKSIISSSINIDSQLYVVIFEEISTKSNISAVMPTISMALK